MIALTDQFVDNVRRSPVTVDRGDRTVLIRASSARAGLLDAELEVVDGDEIVGYITPYGSAERGAVRARLFGLGAPVIHRTLETALDEILS